MGKAMPPRWSLPAALAAIALALTGCGDSKSKPNDSPADLVSQSIEGDIQGHVTFNGTTFALTGKVLMYFDVDTMDARADQDVQVQVKGKTFPGIANLLFNATEKRATAFVDASVGIIPIRKCVYKDLKDLPDVQDLRAVIKARVEGHKPSGMDGDYRRFRVEVPPLEGLSGYVAMDLDNDNGLRKADGSIDVKMPTDSGKGDASFVGTKATVGKPDASNFKVPAAWGACTEGPKEELEASPLGAQRLLVSLLAAAGAGEQPAQPEAVVVV
eukprot:CAMPEP_0168483000 /NCGR_PEP_ID=MMETSP0228-20121227/65338_1 /TAXON_ID=133427 /ORGANISM="Protoceratium reticulatum, Strain CCCM 535 (=CCMP 1889)" /LENGTH=270 /DNA_ID=CAMNT_0008499459 /DNA_START=59 /DNA_END=871 /DNA_ORIENTATION=-